MTGSMIAVWKGPFPDAELNAAEVVPYPLKFKNPAVASSVVGGSAVVLGSTASQMAASDPSWWQFH